MIRVPVVGDEPRIRTGFQRILDVGGGIEVVGAVSGGQALRRVRETGPDGGPPVLAAWKGHGPVPVLGAAGQGEWGRGQGRAFPQASFLRLAAIRPSGRL